MLQRGSDPHGEEEASEGQSPSNVRMYAADMVHHNIEQDPPEYLSVKRPNQLHVIARGGIIPEWSKKAFSAPVVYVVRR